MLQSNSKTHKENWLLTVFIVLFMLGISGFFFFDTSELVHNSRSQERISLLALLVAAILVAPFLEELTFRGAFLESKKSIGISLVLTAGFVALTYSNYYAVGVFACYIIVLLAYNKSKKFFKLVCTLNAILFGLVHYKMEDFTSFDRGFIVLFQISIGFLLIWITINFGLVKSMIAHGIYNTLAMGMLVFSLQFPDTKINTYEDENIKVEWQNVPYFESLTSRYTISEDSIITKSITLRQIYPSLYVVDTLRQKKMIIVDPFTKQNFRIILKENAVNKDIETATETFLLNEKLIIIDTSKN